MAEALEDKLVISILAGSTIAQLCELVPASCRVVRAMPNTPTRVCTAFTDSALGLRHELTVCLLRFVRV